MSRTVREALTVLPLLLAIVSAPTAPVHAITRDWVGGDPAGTTSWHIAANWNLAVVPQPGDDVNIPSGGAHKCVYTTLAGTTTLNSLTSAGDFEMVGGQLELAAASTIGGEFRQTSGTLRPYATLDITAPFAGVGTGTLKLSGGTNTFQATSSVTVGNVELADGTNTFQGPFQSTLSTVTDGTTVFSPGAEALDIGSDLTVSGGSVRIGRDFNAGNTLSSCAIGGTGVVYLDVPATFTWFTLTAGRLEPSAALEITSSFDWQGGKIWGGGAGTSIITANAGVTLSGSAIKILWFATLIVRAGDMSMWTEGNLDVCSARVENQGHFAADFLASPLDKYILQETDGDCTGTVFENQGIFWVLNASTVGLGSGVTFEQTESDAQTQLADGTIQTTTLTVRGGKLTGSGTIDGNVVCEGSARISPGFSVNVTTITGDLTMGPNTHLDIEIEGTSGPGVANGHDQVDVQGKVTLECPTQNVTLLSGFTPTVSDTFPDVLKYNTREGLFGNVPSLVGGVHFWRTYRDSSPPPPGMDGMDLVAASQAPPDCNNDGTVDECQAGACCLAGGGCVDVPKADCDTVGGTWFGACRRCWTQNVALIREAGGGIFVHVISPSVGCRPQPVTRLEEEDCLPGGVLIDPWESPADGEMCHQFGVAGSPAIPADFFAPGSDPFTGSVCLEGSPLGPTPYGEFGDADTLIGRTEDPFDECDLPSATESTVAIDVVALNLVSTDPITVMVSSVPEQWEVAVDLSEVAPPSGTLTAVKSHCDGGTFTSVLPVLPKFTFTKVGAPGEVRVLDTGLESLDPITLIQDVPAPWVTTVEPELGAAADLCSDFHGGIEEPNPQPDCDCDGNLVHDACQPDCSGDGVPDVCEPDDDGDGVPNPCDQCPGFDNTQCDDGNDCTIDDCVSGDVCVYENVSDGTACQGGTGTCVEGQCIFPIPTVSQWGMTLMTLALLVAAMIVLRRQPRGFACA